MSRAWQAASRRREVSIDAALDAPGAGGSPKLRVLQWPGVSSGCPRFTLLPFLGPPGAGRKKDGLLVASTSRGPDGPPAPASHTPVTQEGPLGSGGCPGTRGLRACTDRPNPDWAGTGRISRRAGHPTLDSCSPGHWRLPLIRATVEPIKVEVHTGSVQKMRGALGEEKLEHHVVEGPRTAEGSSHAPQQSTRCARQR